MIFSLFYIFCVLILHPKKFKYNVSHKNRKFFFIKNYKLQYGQVGLKLLQSVFITSSFIFRTHMLIKKGTKRSEKTLRTFWFSVFPNQPLTEKPKGSRMGKGKGKRFGWVSRTRPGFFLYELKNLRLGRSFYFLFQLQNRMPVKSKIFFLTIGSFNINKITRLPIHI